MTNSIVPAPELSVLETKVEVSSYQAIQTLKTGKLPTKHIKTLPGKGGQQFLYVSHIQGTRTMNDAFDQFWDWEVLDEKVYADNSVTVRGRITIHYFTPDGILFHTRKIAEVGAREMPKDKNGKDAMSLANLVLGAASRSLIRCMLRAFNYGAELYKDEEDDFTPAIAWKMLQVYAATCGLPIDELKGHMKELGIQYDELVDKFSDAYAMVYREGQEYQEALRMKADVEKKARAAALADEKAKKAVEAAEEARKALAKS